MRTWVNTAISAAAVTGAVLLGVPAAAHAAGVPSCYDVSQQTGNNYGLLNGTQLYAPIDLDLGITHNALGILGSGYVNDTSNDPTFIYCW